MIGDLISPFKAMLSCDYKAAETRILAAVHLRFGLPASLPPAMTKAVKRADAAAAFLEAVNLAGFSLAEAKRYFPQPRHADADRRGAPHALVGRQDDADLPRPFRADLRGEPGSPS